MAPATPADESRFGLFRVRSPLLTESRVDFFSCRYLDVSVLRVRSMRAMNSAAGDAICLHSGNGFPHSEIPGSKLVCQLPGAYRSLTTSFIASSRLDIHHAPLVA